MTVNGGIPLEELASLPNYYLPSLSSKKDKLAFYWDKSGRVELYIMDLGERVPRKVSNSDVPKALRAGFVWDRNDECIYFAKDRDGDEQHDIWNINASSGATAQLTNNSSYQEYPVELSPDNQWLTVFSNKAGQLNLFKMKTDGSDYVQLSDYSSPVASGGNWSPDGEWLAYGVNETENLWNADLYRMKADGSAKERLLQIKEGSRENFADWSPDGEWMLFTSDAAGDERPGLLNVESKEIRWLGEDGVSESAVCFSPSGEKLLCLRNFESQVSPVIYDRASGQRRDLNLKPGLTAWCKFIHEDLLLVSVSSSNQREAFILYDLERDVAEVLLEAEYGSISPKAFVEREHLYYESFDKRQIPALLSKPHGAEENERLPAIMMIHGGPTGQFFRGFDPYPQFLVSQGYVVLQPNVRGSTGYGAEFRDLNRMDWGGGDLEDVVAGAEYLKSLSFVDPDRIGIFGGSYGGFMTMIATTKRPDLWKAAAAWVGVSDLHLLHKNGMEHFQYYLEAQMGDPKENHDLWRDRSAIEFAGQLKAKMLLGHGVHDPRCPVEQSRLFRDKLVEHGFKEKEDFEYFEFEDQGHGSNDIQHKTNTYRILRDFLARNL
jgi:dipeptidyl aminopeptidase/acylaminoacyl peptidase